MRDSRRARLTLTILLLVAFTLVTLDYRSGALGGVRRGAATVFGPVENTVGAAVRPVGSFFGSLGHLSSYKHDNAQLKKQIAALQTQVRLSAQQRSELTQLQKIDHLAGEAQYQVVVATVVADGPLEGFEWTATINRGSANGIRRDETVINGDGLVGKTAVVGRHTTTIELANDPSSTVGARVESSGEVGTLTGGGRDDMTLTLLSTRAHLAVGDRLVTYASLNDTPYVPEVPLGHVVSVAPANGATEITASVVPYVDYTSLDEVAVVIAAPKTIKRDSLLPPKPSPTPTPTVTKTVTVTPTPGTSTSTGTTSSP